jgi:hypothetical protein
MAALSPVELCEDGGCRACECRHVILSSSKATAVGRRRLCLVGGTLARMLIVNGYKLRSLRVIMSSFFFFLSLHLLKRLP